MSDSEEDIFLTQSSFNGSINSGNDLENLLGDYENAQCSIERQQKGCLASTRRISRKKSQSAELTRRLKQMRRKRRRGISSS